MEIATDNGVRFPPRDSVYCFRYVVSEVYSKGHRMLFPWKEAANYLKWALEQRAFHCNRKERSGILWFQN
jgi:hypothetical protein